MKFKWIFGQRRFEGELSSELQFHLQQEFEKNLSSGMPKEEAWRQAKISFGGVEGIKEECRELRFGSWLESSGRDVLHGLRLLRKSPGFAFVAVAILALSIGANTAIFSALNAVLLARWPFPHPDKIVFVSEDANSRFGWSLTSIPNFEDYRRQQKTLDQLALWMPQSVNLTGNDRPDRLIGSFVTSNFFDLFNTRPFMGRLFLPGEDQPGAPYVVVLSYEAWQTRFGSDPQILGRQVTLNNESYSIVGVLPRGYRLPFDSDVYITAQHQTSYRRDRATKSLPMLGRVKQGVSLAQARADLNTIAQRLGHDYPNENAGIGIVVTDFRQVLNQNVRMPLLVLMAAVALVLLIACANLANLVLARSLQRRSEMAIRTALGARRARIMRQLVSEAIPIAIAGGVGGLLLGKALLPLLTRMAPSSFRDVTISLDGRVLLFTSLLTLLTAVLFAIAPAVQLSGSKRASGLNSGNKGTVRTDTAGRVRAAFVIFQVAMSIMLLVGAALVVRSFQKLMASDTGLSIENLLTMEYRLPRNKYSSPEAQAAFHRELALRVAQVPGVVSSAIVQALPFSGNWGNIHFIPEGVPVPEKGKEPTAFTNLITPEYFGTVGIPLLRGRIFNDHDDAAAPKVAVVSRALARQYFGGQDPIGKTFQLVDSDPNINGQRLTVVGVVGNVKQISLRDRDEAEIYFPYLQRPGIFGTLVLRTAVDPMSLAGAVRQAVWSLDKDQPVWKIRTLEYLVQRDVEDDRLLMVLMTGFGLLAVLLTALGTYGVLSNTVGQRRQEIGIRIALGADRGMVRNLVIRQGMKMVLAGIAIGGLAAVAVSRAIASVLYGISALDIGAYAAGFAVMVAVALLASYLPARSATRVDPAVVLRYE
ncbi:MAG TPA: ABC transporter permease [Terriglobales bacterium]|nr:ABC transporter permease [Terriglobales bacterium]